MKILLTGAAGFVGSHTLRHILTATDWTVACPVSFRHKGLPQRIVSAVAGVDDWQDRVRITYWDMRAPASNSIWSDLADSDVVMNIASESHVDRSIAAPVEFVRNNVDLQLNMLELARAVQPRLFLQMSTDEVYGPAYGDYRHAEWDPAIPSNPYSASKAAQEAVAVSYWRTYGVPIVITNTMNIIGEMQDPEKFLPMIIRNLRNGAPITVHVAPDGAPGSRYYLHARNLADAWVWLVRHYEMTRVPSYDHAAQAPMRLHIVGEREISNLELVYAVGKLIGMDRTQIGDLVKPVSFHASRPGHDLRYALNGAKLASMGWSSPLAFDESLARTVEWYLANPRWLEI